MIAKIGETSGDTYTYGTYNNGTTYTFIARLTSSFSYVWYKLYIPRGSSFSFDVSPTEDFFYYLEKAENTNDNLRLCKCDASNGNMVFSFSLTSFWTEQNAHIGITPSNDALYINTDSFDTNTTHRLLIMR